MTFLKNAIYRIKNSNVTVHLSLNAFSWRLLPSARRVRTYSDEWWCSSTLIEYKLVWLFIKITILLETGTHDADDPYDLI